MQETIAFIIAPSVWLFLFFCFAFLLAFLHFLDVFAFLYKLKMPCFCPYYDHAIRLLQSMLVFAFLYKLQMLCFAPTMIM